MTEPQPIRAKTAKELLDAFLLGKKTQPREEKPPTMMRLSASGGCTRRAIFTKLDPTPEDLSPRSLSIFELGDALHAMERGDMLALGVPIKDIERKVKLVVPAGPLIPSDPDEAPGHGEGTEIPGHIDGIVEIDGEDVLLDVKTMNANSFSKLLREGISEDYQAQLNSYLHALGLKRAVLWCYNKNDSDRALVEYTYSPELQERIFAHFRTAHNHKPGDALPPPSYEPYDQRKARKPTGLSVLHFKCGYCPFRERCWPHYQQDLTSDKPKFVFDFMAADLDSQIGDL